MTGCRRYCLGSLALGAASSRRYMRKVRGSADLVTHHPPTSSFPPTSFNTLCTLPAGPPCSLMPTAILFCSPRPRFAE
jgi:hypothetical protein